MRNGRGEADLRKTGAVPGPGSPVSFYRDPVSVPAPPGFERYVKSQVKCSSLIFLIHDTPTRSHSTTSTVMLGLRSVTCSRARFKQQSFSHSARTPFHTSRSEFTCELF